jgi:hypothetical protein
MMDVGIRGTLLTRYTFLDAQKNTVFATNAVFLLLMHRHLATGATS